MWGLTAAQSDTKTEAQTDQTTRRNQYSTYLVQLLRDCEILGDLLKYLVKVLLVRVYGVDV